MRNRFGLCQNNSLQVKLCQLRVCVSERCQRRLLCHDRLTWAMAERDPTAVCDALAALGENALNDGPIQFSRTFVEVLTRVWSKMIAKRGRILRLRAWSRRKSLNASFMISSCSSD